MNARPVSLFVLIAALLWSCAVEAAPIRVRIGGFTGVMASLAGKSPPDLRYWLVTGDVPAFVRFEGAMLLNGPVWQLEMATVEWPK